MRRILIATLVLGCKNGDAGSPTPTQESSTVQLPTVALERVVAGLVAPTKLATAPDGTMVVLEQDGHAFRIVQNSVVPFANISDRVVQLDHAYDERGLLGLAFHPDYPKTRHVFLYYSAPLRASAPPEYDHTNVLSRFEVGPDGMVDARTEKKLLELDWPARNHDGGTLMFGPDRMLYFSLGDGGNRSDIGKGHPPAGNGQDVTTLPGSILRIDPDGGDPYAIPPDNPFAGDHPGADEIWAYGLRNPYSFSFDTKTGRMFAGDVGQELIEEVNIIERGKNYGWSEREGPVCFDKYAPEKPPSECAQEGAFGEPFVDPIVWYTQADSSMEDRSPLHGTSVIGGYVYRGSRLPELQGMYVFGEWSARQEAPEGWLAVAHETDTGWKLEQLKVEGQTGAHMGLYVRGFGQGLDGELYVLTSEREGPEGKSGAVWRIVPATRTRA